MSHVYMYLEMTSIPYTFIHQERDGKHLDSRRLFFVFFCCGYEQHQQRWGGSTWSNSNGFWCLFKPAGPAALLETPLVVKTTCFGLTSAVVEINESRLCEAGTGRVPGLRKKTEGRTVVHLIFVDGWSWCGCCCIGKKTCLNTFASFATFGHGQMKTLGVCLFCFFIRPLCSCCITLCLYSLVCSAFIKRLSQLVLRIALSIVSLCSLISVLAIRQCMATANTLPCIISGLKS